MISKDQSSVISFRPHSDVKDRWDSDNVGNGFYKFPYEWLTTPKPDLIIGFFDYCESFGGPQNLDRTHRPDQAHRGHHPKW